MRFFKTVGNTLQNMMHRSTSVPEIKIVGEKSAILEAWSMVERLSEGNINTKTKRIRTFQNLQGDDYYTLLKTAIETAIEEEKENKPRERNKPSKKGIVVYIGIFPFDKLIDKLRQVYQLESTNEDLKTGEKFTLALYFDRNLNLINDKTFFTESGFILWNGGSIAEHEEFQKYESQEKQKLAERFYETAEKPDKFNAAFNAILQEMGTQAKDCRMQTVNNIEWDVPNFHSFFLGDLDKACKLNTDNLNRYFNGGGALHNLDFKKDSPNFNPKQLRKILEPKNYPLGRYPSNTKYRLSLMQQVAVNLSIGYDNQKIRSVNGPPGTGKTTLLKDIFAELVVQQAYELAKTNSGEIKGGSENAYRENCCIGQLPIIVAENNIIVASSNNGAVRNIVNEIPLIKDIDEKLIGELKDADYFWDIANSEIIKIYETGEDGKRHEIPELIPNKEEKYWGLFSLQGGRWDNEQKIYDTVKQVVKYLNAEYVSHPEVYQVFLAQYEKVKEMRRRPACPFVDWKKLTYDKLQKSNPWFDEQFRIAQSRLFITALAVRKQFLYENRKNLDAAVEIMSKQDAHLERKHVIQIAFEWINLAIPVISSTFASFARMFRNFAENSLGHLFIDEAGQALPQAGVGAILRSKNVMAVGDPSQIKPVLTLDSKVLGMLCKHYGISEKYLSDSASVQTLVDSASQYGFYRKSDQRAAESWIGIPLWVHRRCGEPMFTISNRISYGGLMVQDNSKFGKTGWFDISGNAENKYVKEQGEFLVQKIEALIQENPAIVDKKEKDVIYVISPFANVAEQLVTKLKNIDDFVRYNENGKPANVGTIHTFQGKEAPIVFLVLGADTSSKGAAGWAVGEPNMMNVAATRAKEEFYLIGDKQLYSGIDSDVVSQTHAAIAEYAREHPDLIADVASATVPKSAENEKEETVVESPITDSMPESSTIPDPNSVKCPTHSSSTIAAISDTEALSWGKAHKLFGDVPDELKDTKKVNQLLSAKGYIAQNASEDGKSGWVVTDKGREIGIVQSDYDGKPTCNYTEVAFKAVLKILTEN